MNWADLQAFIEKRNPGFLSNVTGVPTEDIRLCEKMLGIQLPTLYVDFLLSMGADCGDFPPFGGRQSCGFYDVLAEQPKATYPTQRYFKVSWENDSSAVPCLDTFIDLGRSDGHDAPLVWIEDTPDFAQNRVSERNCTLSEQLTQSVFGFFEVLNRPKTDNLWIIRDTPEELEQTKNDLFALLGTMDFKGVWPPAQRVGCFAKKNLSILVRLVAETDSILLNLGGDNQKVLKIAIAQIREQFPKMLD